MAEVGRLAAIRLERDRCSVGAITGAGTSRYRSLRRDHQPLIAPAQTRRAGRTEVSKRARAMYRMSHERCLTSSGPAHGLPRNFCARGSSHGARPCEGQADEGGPGVEVPLPQHRPRRVAARARAADGFRPRPDADELDEYVGEVDDEDDETTRTTKTRTPTTAPGRPDADCSARAVGELVERRERVLERAPARLRPEPASPRPRLPRQVASARRRAAPDPGRRPASGRRAPLATVRGAGQVTSGMIEHSLQEEDLAVAAVPGLRAVEATLLEVAVRGVRAAAEAEVGAAWPGRPRPRSDTRRSSPTGRAAAAATISSSGVSQHRARG